MPGLKPGTLTLLLATRNPKKARELRRLLNGARSPLAVRIVTLDQFPDLPKVAEDGATFKANAIKKSLAVSRRTILPVLADDSGLEVRALNGRPGVRSARFSGPRQDDRANNAKLLKLLKGIPASRRKARFVCWIALAVGGRLIQTFQGTCAGSIAFQPAGRSGFGYDPLFIPAGCERTMAQLGSSRKDLISHRARAIARLRDWLLRAGSKTNP